MLKDFYDNEFKKQKDDIFNNQLFDSYNLISSLLIQNIKDVLNRIWWCNEEAIENGILHITIEQYRFRIWLERGKIAIKNISICKDITTCKNMFELLDFIDKELDNKD